MIRVCILLLAVGLWACDDQTPAGESPPTDGFMDMESAPPEPAEDAGGTPVGDSGPGDAAPIVDAEAVLDATPDQGPMDPLGCPTVVSPRLDPLLRTDGCRFQRAGQGTVLPRGVVVSADSLNRELGTPYHEAEHYSELAEAGFDLAWLLVTWKGIEPREGEYNGAYMGRVCEHVGYARGAGLDVVLAMHQTDFGPAVGGLGMPEWVAADARSVASAWGVFWTQRVPQFTAAWGRLLATCPPETALTGIAPLVGPRGAGADWTALAGAVRETAEDRFGPLLLFVEPPIGIEGYGAWSFVGPDVVMSPSGWGLGVGPEGSGGDETAWLDEAAQLRTRFGVPLFFRQVGSAAPEGLSGALAGVEARGAAFAVWQDGFGGDFALRDEDGQPGAGWDAATANPWPVSIAGSFLGQTRHDEGWLLRWWHDGNNQGVSRVGTGAFGEVYEVRLGGEEVEPIWAYDPSTGEVTLVIDGPPRIVEVFLGRMP